MCPYRTEVVEVLPTLGVGALIDVVRSQETVLSVSFAVDQSLRPWCACYRASVFAQ